MSNQFRHVARVATLGLFAVFVACDKSPTSPPAMPPAPQPPSPAGPSIVRLEVVGPSQVTPGESVQLTANAIKSDGSLEDVSRMAQWSSSASTVLTVNSTGLASGRSRGEASVRARFGGHFVDQQILVLPAGTFRLTGIIREDGFGIAGVAVSVISGNAEGLTTISGSSGSYTLYGVSGRVGLLARKEGYRDSTQQVDVTAHRTYDFAIAPERSRSDYTGRYTLTISASTCRESFVSFPEAARRRVYTANVTQDGARLTVLLGDADFIVTQGHGNGFAGFIDTTDVIRFSISDASFDYYYYFGEWDIAERFDNTALVLGGLASVKGTSAHLSGPMKGSILVSREGNYPFAPFTAACSSDTHGFEMVRR